MGWRGSTDNVMELFGKRHRPAIGHQLPRNPNMQQTILEVLSRPVLCASMSRMDSDDK